MKKLNIKLPFMKGRTKDEAKASQQIAIKDEDTKTVQPTAPKSGILEELQQEQEHILADIHRTIDEFRKADEEFMTRLENRIDIKIDKYHANYRRIQNLKNGNRTTDQKNGMEIEKNAIDKN